jgi:hypothetical protein
MLGAFTTVHELPLAPETLLNAPAALREAPANFSSFNPALLAPPRARADRRDAPTAAPTDAPLLAFFRVSNIHFCPASGRRSWRDSVRLQTHIRSYLALAELRAADRTLRAPAEVLGAASALFRADGARCEHRIDAGGGASGTFSGPEDPRPFWGLDHPRAPWLLAAAWSADCRRLRMHLVKLPPRGARDGASARSSAAGGASAPQQLRLFVDDWPPAARLPHPEREPLQKNWLPFVHGGALLVEYSIEPHAVLAVDARSGRCVPATAAIAAAAGGTGGTAQQRGAQFPSFPPLARLQLEFGRVSGGAPPLHLDRHSVYLGLAHSKATRQTPQLIGTAQMAYRHLFYAFEDRPPFAIVAAGKPMLLPEPSTTRLTAAGEAGEDLPTVQFAAGMALSEAGDELVVSFSSLDCGAHLTTIPLDAVLTELGLLW